MSKNLRELEHEQEKLEYGEKELKVFIADVLPIALRHETDMQDRLLEVENLVNTYGWVVILSHIQKRGTPDYDTYIGEWKLDELIEQMKEQGANLLILWNILKPHQIYKVNEKLKLIWAKAWDRVDLILKIFEKNAKTMESKLQIELASIKYMWPRIFGMWMELWSQWSGGAKLSRWKWETNTEIMKRHLAERILNIKKDLEQYKKVRAEHRRSRSKKWLSTVWVVWYTNAGKSSLMNVLTRKWVLSEDKLFATLGTSVWKMYIENEYSQTGEFLKHKEVLINDTIWFIRDLPPNLIDAFASTLEDSVESDLILHVIDASDVKIDEKIKVVDDILLKIWANQKKLYIFNKIDLITSERLEELAEKYINFHPLFISSHKNTWILELKKEILKQF